MKRNTIILIICAVVLVGIAGGYIISNRVSANKKLDEAQYFGGEVSEKNKPKWQKMPDKTSELQPKFEKEITAKYDVTITQNEQQEGRPMTFSVVAKDEQIIKPMCDDLLQMYIKYRDEGYKGVLFVYLNDRFITGIPPR